MPDNKQLKERLRDSGELMRRHTFTRNGVLMEEAADTIERLEAERERDAAVLEGLRKALQRIAEGDVPNVVFADLISEFAEAALQHAQEQVGESDGEEFRVVGVAGAFGRPYVNESPTTFVEAKRIAERFRNGGDRSVHIEQREVGSWKRVDEQVGHD